MINIILSLIGGIKGLIVGVLGLLGGAWALWAKNKMNCQANTIERQDQAIKVHEAKEEVHKQDEVTDQETDMRIDKLRNEVDNAETPEQGAGQVSGAINDYFRGNEK